MKDTYFMLCLGYTALQAPFRIRLTSGYWQIVWNTKSFDLNESVYFTRKQNHWKATNFELDMTNKVHTDLVLV